MGITVSSDLETDQHVMTDTRAERVFTLGCNVCLRPFVTLNTNTLLTLTITKLLSNTQNTVTITVETINNNTVARYMMPHKNMPHNNCNET